MEIPILLFEKLMAAQSANGCFKARISRGAVASLGRLEPVGHPTASTESSRPVSAARHWQLSGCQ